MRAPISLTVVLCLLGTGVAQAESLTFVTDYKAGTKARRECAGKVSTLEQGALPAIWSCDGFKDVTPIPVVLAGGERIECDPTGDISGYVGHGIMQCSLKRPVVLTVRGAETRCSEFVVISEEGTPKRCWGKSRRVH